MRPEEVLRRPTPPPNQQNRWHVTLQGHPEELLDALEIIAFHEERVIKSAEWIADDTLVICLEWIDEVISKLVEQDIHKVSDYIKIKQNGRVKCHGHHLA